jgi:hypothetical protein
MKAGSTGRIYQPSGLFLGNPAGRCYCFTQMTAWVTFTASSAATTMFPFS